MPKLTPSEFAEKHGSRLKAALEDIRRGIERVSVSPTSKAAEKQAKMKARINEAIDSGKWANNLKRVSLEEWKAKARDVGVNRIPAGVDAAKGKVQDFASQLLPYQDSIKAKIQSMPDLTLEDRINRMTMFVREMAKFRKK